ncbi:MAG: efflux RND transporter permease subunit, partial [Alistipes sp.]|nr:efflux RND transporter permease subunit [Alistipes sp.]
MERELRTLSSVDEISSVAHFGYGELMVKLHPWTSARQTPQIWDELRSKVEDARSKLPSGIGQIDIADDFGDVFGLYYALTADEGFNYEQMRHYAKLIERELYHIEGVDKIRLSGEQQSEICITISPSTLA